MTHTSIHEFYEKLLEEASFDLHERYSQLLTGLQWKVNEEDALLISYIIEDMRERSSSYSPVALRQWGVFRAWKTHAKQLANRHGIEIEFQESPFHDWNEGDPYLFRLLQQTLQFIIQEDTPEIIRVSVDSESLLLFYEKDQPASDGEERIKEFASTADVDVSVRKEGPVTWILKRRRDDDDINISCG